MKNASDPGLEASRCEASRVRGEQGTRDAVVEETDPIARAGYDVRGGLVSVLGPAALAPAFNDNRVGSGRQDGARVACAACTSPGYISR